MSRIQIPILTFILLGLSAYVGVLLFANLSAVVPQSSIKNWQQAKVLPQEKSWQINLDQIQVAIKLDPSNPEFLEAEAQLYRYHAFMFEVNSDEAIVANRVALSKYQHLLTLRPSWAPYWSSIVTIKYALWEYDQLMIDALHNAARLAPWFRRNQFTIMRAGIHGWPYLDKETKSIIKQTIERAMLLQPKQTIEFAKKQGFEEWLDPYL